jgi:ABC-type multidrug transport system fused ATPase/permease subunit
MVSQDPVLFCTSIFDNITFGVPSARLEDVVHAATMANAHHFISQFPQGYATVVGERGVRLSGACLTL